MLRKDQIKKNVLEKKISTYDLLNIHRKVREWYYNMSEWNAADKLKKLLAVEIDKIIELYVQYNNPALYRIYKKYPTLCRKLDSFVVSVFMIDSEQDNYTEESGGRFEKIVQSLDITISFDSLAQKPPTISDRFSGIYRFSMLDSWVTKNFKKIPELKPLITKIRTIQNGIIREEYKRINDKVSDIYAVLGEIPYSFSTDFKDGSCIVTIGDLFDFDPELFLYYCRSEGIKHYLKTWEKQDDVEKDDSLYSIIEKLKKIL